MRNKKALGNAKIIWMNKRAEEKYFSLIWLIVLAFIGGMIVIGVLIFSSANIDVRKAESQILITKVSDCLVNNGYINEDAFNENFNFFQECQLSEDVLDESGKYYVSIRVVELDSASDYDMIKPIEIGVLDFKMQCSIKNKEGHFPVCAEKEISALGSDGLKRYLIKINAGSNNQGTLF